MIVIISYAIATENVHFILFLVLFRLNVKKCQMSSSMQKKKTRQNRGLQSFSGQ